MQIQDSFRVSLPIEQAWEVLRDLERLAPCMPGAELTGVEDDEYRGVVRVKVGSVITQYQGVARIEEEDEDARVVVVRAEGREARGQGRAAATIRAQLKPDGDGTGVTVTTDLQISGRVAQFGRGVLQDVSSNLMRQFAEALERELARGAAGPEERPGPAEDAGAEDVPVGAAMPAEAAGGGPAARARAAEPVDLVAVSRGPVLKRLVPLAALALVLAAVVAWRRRA